MSIGSILKKIGKSKITRTIGKGIDFGSDFLPPGFRDVGNLGGKLLQGQNLKRSLIGTGMDYAGGRLAKGLSGKLQGIGKSAVKQGIAGGIMSPVGLGAGVGLGSPSADLMTRLGDPSVLTAGMKNIAGAGPNRLAGPMAAAVARGPGFDWGGALKTGIGAVAGSGGSMAKPDWKSRALGGIGDFLKGGNPNGGIDLGKLAKYALPALGAYQASKAAAKADEYRKKGLAGAEAEYASRKPLREMGMAGLMDPRMTDVSSLFNKPRPQYRRIG